MLTEQEYDRTRKGDTVIVCRPIGNLMIRVAAGSRMTVIGKYAGLALLGEECSCCGAQAEFSRVSRFDVSLPVRA